MNDTAKRLEKDARRLKREADLKFDFFVEDNMELLQARNEELFQFEAAERASCRTNDDTVYSFYPRSNFGSVSYVIEGGVQVQYMENYEIGGRLSWAIPFSLDPEEDEKKLSAAKKFIVEHYEKWKG